ncbi:MAG: hypothetical protein ACPHXR_04725 [Flavicella sp.]
MKTASFSWGQAWFKMRGYEASEQTIWIDGVSMMSPYDNKPSWSNWGGLNEVLRNSSYHLGSTSTVFGFPNLGGSTVINTRASGYSSGSQISSALSNNSYTNRFTASHYTGLLKNDWAAAFFVSKRYASEGKFLGTPYDSNSLFMSIEKKLSDKHSLNLSSFYAYRKRGKNGPNTKEVFAIKGPDYNSYWGVQNGRIRNSRLQTDNRPFFILNHYWKLSPSTKIYSAFMYHFGSGSQSRLGYNNAPNPDPTHYSKLPSYAHFNALSNANYNAYGLLKKFEDDGQIDWNALYMSNAITLKPTYYLYEDREELNRFSCNVRMLQNESKTKKQVYGISFDSDIRKYYASPTDLLGAQKLRDVDPFATGTSRQSNLKTIDRDVLVGEHFKYNFKLYFSQLSLFLQQSYELSKIEHRHSIRLLYTQFQRDGLYQNGQYPNTSFGKSTQKQLLDWGLNSETLFKINNRHLLSLDFSVFSKPIALKNAFSNIRIHNAFSPNTSSSLVFGNALNYYHRGTNLKFRFTCFYTLLQQLTETSFTYVQGYREDIDDFVSQILSNISKKHLGIELGLNYILSSTLKAQFVTSLGTFTYANHPDLYLFSDNILLEESYAGKAYIKNYKLGGTAQNAYALGLEYNAPNYWWLGVNYNLLTHNYVRIAPLLRTSQFYNDSEGLPYVDTGSGDFIRTSENLQRIPQERLQDVFLANIVGGKSWKLQDRFVRLFVGVNNIFGKVYKTGGFEQSRKASYQGFFSDTLLKNPLFGNKYWMGFGPSYFVNLSIQM